ncbi:hypothetical protein [Streptomyces anulatus]|uniref:hypothetical protein n=1 Tax=Streptomyces anulatus TaxID=1892 RepID=UPI001C259B25|nr:hypothetical protein [Streptomyces anulatus]
MSVIYHVAGTVTFDAPAPTAAFWELLEAPYASWLIAKSGSEEPSQLHERERLLIPADHTTLDEQGRPAHIKAIAVDWDDRSHIIGDALRSAALAVYSSGGDLADYDIGFRCEDGSKGEIVFYADEDEAVLGWEETSAPGRSPGVFGCVPWAFQPPQT